MGALFGRRNAAYLFVVTILLNLIAAQPSWPQSVDDNRPSSGSVTGNVTNSSGTPVPGAKVMVLHLQTGVAYFVATDARGIYVVRGLDSGPYKVRISAPSLRSEVRQPVHIDSNSEQRIDMKLDAVEPGQDGDTILASGGPARHVPEDLARSPVIASIAVATPPLVPFESNGDLWFSTWADDGNLYGTWGTEEGRQRNWVVT